MPDRGDPWDTPGLAQPSGQIPQQPQIMWDQQQPPAAHQPPLIIGGMEFSREDDIENMEKLSNVFGQVFYSMILGGNDPAGKEAWQGLANDIGQLAEYAAQVPALALPVAMCLYNYFWWEGPDTLEPNIAAAHLASELMSKAVVHARCNDPSLPAMDFFINQCHLRWRYLMMITGEVARYLVIQRRDIVRGARVLAQLNLYFQELRKIAAGEMMQGTSPYQVNFNMDYYPGSVAVQGPVWRNPLQDVPIASFLEANFPTIRGEIDAILAKGSTFRDLDEQTRNAETQFGPRGDDWMTAYMFRKGEAIDSVCQHAPKTCALLSTRPEIANCKMGGSGAGFLRMSPGGRLKPHFGNAPRLSVHLGLIVPPGEIRMSVGYESVTWEEGKVIVFDDTFIHQVVHNGNEPRFVMNVWMCHPCDPSDGKLPGEGVPAYCDGAPGQMTRLGLMPLPRA